MTLGQFIHLSVLLRESFLTVLSNIENPRFYESSQAGAPRQMPGEQVCLRGRERRNPDGRDLDVKDDKLKVIPG